MDVDVIQERCVAVPVFERDFLLCPSSKLVITSHCTLFSPQATPVPSPLLQTKVRLLL